MRDTVYGSEIWEDFSHFSTDNAVVWIDPLDGTKDYVLGNLSAVTVLIGLAIEGHPKLGVVHHPFRSNENDGFGMTMFASQEHGLFKLDYNHLMTKADLQSRVPTYIEPFNPCEQFSDEYKIKVAASLNNFNARF
jgi:3'-phosphoadenosine 5'-phosphosulfate (PAPS) 3'-phosphatase